MLYNRHIQLGLETSEIMKTQPIFYCQEELDDIILQAKYQIKDAYLSYDSERICEIFTDIWPVIQAFIKEKFYQIDEQGNILKPTLEEAEHRSHFRYEFTAWLTEMEVEYSNAHRQLDRIHYCNDILELFASDDFYTDSFKAAIGEAYNFLEYYSDCDAYFRNWLALEPHNSYAINVYSLCLIMRSDLQGARTLIETYIPLDLPICEENLILFERAEEFYALIGDEKKADEYASKIQNCSQNSATLLKEKSYS